MKYIKKYKALPKSEEDRRRHFWEDNEFNALENLGFKADSYLDPFIFNLEISDKIKKILIYKFKIYSEFYKIHVTYKEIEIYHNKTEIKYIMDGFDQLIDYLKKLIPEDIKQYELEQDAKKYNL